MFERDIDWVYAYKMRLINVFILIIFSCSLAAETVYKTVDENGNIIFTDKPSEEAEEIIIKDLETIDNPNPAKYKPSSKPAEETNTYNSIVISSPEDNAAIRSNNGNVTISVSLEPALRSSHKIEIMMDGQNVGSGTSVSLENVNRGTHSVTASVIDANGKNIISTSSNFSLLRASQ